MSPRLRSPLCERLGIEFPVIQGAIGSATCPELAAAVSNAGGLGMLALSWTETELVRAAIRATRKLTDRPFGVNLVLDFLQHERMQICLEESVPIISTFWGDPEPYRDVIQRMGAIHLHTVGSAREARDAVAVGADAIVAQGWEAGGHVRGQVASFALTPAVVDAVAPVPVITAGGVADGRGLAAALALGAQAVWVGTRFLLADEANVHASYRRRIASADETDTLRSTLFDGGWPNAAHRVLRNSTVAAWEDAGRPAGPNRPGEGEIVAWREDGSPLARYFFDEPTAGATGNVEALPLYGGQGCALVRHQAPAAAIVQALVSEAQEALEAVDTYL